jgi:hypothetical protein
MTTYDMNTITPSATITDGTTLLFGQDGQAGGTPKPYTTGGIKAWIQSWLTSAMVGLGNVANALQLEAANNLSDLADAPTARANLGGIYTPYDPDFNDANVYLTPPVLSPPSAGGMSANRLDVMPIWVTRKRTFSTYAMILTTLSGTAAIKTALYADNGSGVPGALLDQSASAIDASTTTGVTGVKTLAFTANQTLNPGQYWLGVLSNGTPSVIRIPNNSSIALGMTFSSAATTLNGTKVATSGITYPTFPNPGSGASFVSQASLTTGTPLVGIR